jgi:hypothetical protein
MPVIPFNRVVDKKNNRKKWWSEEEEEEYRHTHVPR